MHDRAFLVFAGMILAVFVLRILMLAELRRWSAGQQAKLVDAFYQQNKVSSLILVGALALMLVPYVLGSRSVAFALATTLLAGAVAIGGGVWGNVKLRRLAFPARYVLLHAILVGTIAVGMITYSIMLFAA